MQDKRKNISNNQELEKEKNELLSEINKLDKEIKASKKKKVMIISVITILFITIIKVFFGTIEINNIFGYPSNKARFYKVEVNGNPITVDYNLKQTIPIIPFLINFNSNYIGSSSITEDTDGTYYYPNDSKKYIIDINSYSCYENNYQVECKTENQNLKRNNDTKYTKLTITRTNNPYEEVYNGKFINDITKYVEKKGVYCIEITSKYALIETKIYFYFKR